MSKVEIFKDEKNTWHVEVDGVNLAPAIVDGGVRVEFQSYAESPFPLVHLTLRADKLNARLPEATVEAIKKLDPATELTSPCAGECGDPSPHDAHLLPGALEFLGRDA